MKFCQIYERKGAKITILIFFVEERVGKSIFFINFVE